MGIGERVGPEILLPLPWCTLTMGEPLRAYQHWGQFPGKPSHPIDSLVSLWSSRQTMVKYWHCQFSHMNQKQF